MNLAESLAKIGGVYYQANAKLRLSRSVIPSPFQSNQSNIMSAMLTQRRILLQKYLFRSLRLLRVDNLNWQLSGSSGELSNFTDKDVLKKYQFFDPFRFCFLLFQCLSPLGSLARGVDPYVFLKF